MDILFDTTKLARVYSGSPERAREFGPERAKRLGIRLDQMRAAANLLDFKAVHPRCRSLTGNRAGQWSADLDGPYRLIFEIADDPVPVDAHDSINLAEVKKVRIIEIADTHAA